MLVIRGLAASINGKPILKGIDLTVPPGEVHALMGPNGCGKSTLAYVLSGREDYEVTAGTVTFNGADLLAMEPEQRAAAGVFLAFQASVELPGVNNANFLRTAVNAVRRAHSEPEMDAVQFLKLARAETKRLAIHDDMLKIVADGVNALRRPDFSALVITHHQRLLDHLVPNRVHVLLHGRIVRAGGPELAKELEKSGYAGMIAEAA